MKYQSEENSEAVDVPDMSSFASDLSFLIDGFKDGSVREPPAQLQALLTAVVTQAEEIPNIADWAQRLADDVSSAGD